MALYPCDGCYDGYPDRWTDGEFDEDAWWDARQERLDATKDRLYEEIRADEITENQARVRMAREGRCQDQ